MSTTTIETRLMKCEFQISTTRYSCTDIKSRRHRCLAASARGRGPRAQYIYIVPSHQIEGALRLTGSVRSSHNQQNALDVRTTLARSHYLSIEICQQTA